MLAALLRAAPDTLLFVDRLIHASLHAGSAGRRQIRFRHNDLDHLATLLDAHRGETGPRLIVTESVFSMDGDRADIAALSATWRARTMPSSTSTRRMRRAYSARRGAGCRRSIRARPIW